MNYKKQEIKQGITLHTINTNHFKTNLIAVFLSMPLSRQTVTKNTLVSMVLRRGSSNMPSQMDISKTLENMYGASFDCGIEKTGDNHVMKFYLESINDEFLPNAENVLASSIDTILDIILNPFVEQGAFKEEYVAGEKENLKNIIEGKKDNKSTYALARCIEEMYPKNPYGLYKYGYVEDLDSIHAKELYQYYQSMIQDCKIDIFVSGNIEDPIFDMISNNENIKKIAQRKANYIVNNEQTEKKEEKQINTIQEQMDITQGKLVIGMNILDNTEDSKHVALVYNTILGGSANSKLFQNVREKAHLAYVASSNYVRQKNNIFIRCGIEISNFDQAVTIIKQQVEDMKQGNFSQEDLNNAKESIVSIIQGIVDEQDTEISYYLGHELSGTNLTLEEYRNKIQEITKQQVVDIANKIQMDTIYFLKGEEDAGN